MSTLQTGAVVDHLRAVADRAAADREQYTERAYRMLPSLDCPRILDIGCGRGGPSLVLSRASGGHVVGIDVDTEALRVFGRRIAEVDLVHPPGVVVGSLVSMDFVDHGFDVVWTEGAVHVLGPEGSVCCWRRLIKPKGYLVLHDAVWLRADPPPPTIRDYWWQGQHGVSTLCEYMDRIQACGYAVLDSFELPESTWWDTYYAPLQMAVHDLAEQHRGDAAEQAILAERQAEIDRFRVGQRWYGSAFVVCQRDD